MNRLGFCIYFDTLFEGTVPAVRDECDNPYLFATRVEAESEITT